MLENRKSDCNLNSLHANFWFIKYKSEGFREIFTVLIVKIKLSL
jgi:hypothetical protein